MSDVRTVTVRLPEPLHRAVKVRCAERGDSLEGVARAAFVAYLERGNDEPGSVLERAGVRPAGLVKGRISGESPNAGDGLRQSDEGSIPSRSIGRPFRPDPKGGSK